MNEKQQQLIFDKGITNIPSDNLCSDNTLEECIGMVHENGEHHVIQRPVESINGLPSGALIFIHNFNDEKRYIIVKSSVSSQVWYYSFEWGISVNGTYTKKGEFSLWSGGASFTPKVTAVGKTLIITDYGGMHYYLWGYNDGPTYTDLGELPEPKVEFWLESDTNEPYYSTTEDYVKANLDYTVISSQDTHDIMTYSSTVTDPMNVRIYVTEDLGRSQKTFNDCVIGLYSRNKLLVKRKKGFSGPFFVRWALEMRDGTYYHISQPILMVPFRKTNTFSRFDAGTHDLIMLTKLCHLKYSITSNGLEKFGDVVKGITVFVTDDVELYDTLADQSIYELESTDDNNYNIFDGIYRLSSNDISDYRATAVAHRRVGVITTVDVLKRRTYNEKLSDIKALSVFYKLCDIGSNTSSGDIADKIEKTTLENLTTQDILDHDDYFSRCGLSAGCLFAYNSRLNLGNVRRGFFEGYDNFLPYDSNSASTYVFYVKIDTGSERLWIRHEASTKQKQGLYFYYPDTRAKHVTIFKGNNCVCDADLIEHPGLNGAYYIKGLPNVVTEQTVTLSSSGFQYGPSGISGGVKMYDNDTKELLSNYIITSEVNNPWVFQTDGYNVVGTGRILALASVTTALSVGQFGDFPVVAFTDTGIWALPIDRDGSLLPAKPKSRDVLRNTKSVTQTDSAIFFVSQKGLMIFNGEKVACVSEQLNGKDIEFDGEVSPTLPPFSLVDMAYDYRDSLIWMVHSSRYAWVYSIRNGSFCKFDFGTRTVPPGPGETDPTEVPNVVSMTVNDYPDNLFKVGNTLVSLINRPNINSDVNEDYSARIITRPLKLENGLALKTILQMRHIKDISGSMGVRIFASNNLNEWTELHSLGGIPWKYYRLRYDFSGLKATDTFAGTVLTTQERRSVKLR